MGFKFSSFQSELNWSPWTKIRSRWTREIALLENELIQHILVHTVHTPYSTTERRARQKGHGMLSLYSTVHCTAILNYEYQRAAPSLVCSGTAECGDRSTPPARRFLQLYSTWILCSEMCFKFISQYYFWLLVLQYTVYWAQYLSSSYHLIL